MKCEREQQVIEATRDGLWASSLRAHVRDCALCTQTELIAASLQEDAARAERMMLDLPSAGMVWRRAQTRRREAALQRATRRPFLIVRALGAVYSVVLLLVGDLSGSSVRLPSVRRASRSDRGRGTRGRSTVRNSRHCGNVCLGS